MDYMLRQLRASVWKNAAPTDDVNKLIGEYVSPLVSTPPTCNLLLLIFHHRTFVHILQEDLLKCPGSRRGMKLLSNINPEWQTAIQQSCGRLVYVPYSIHLVYWIEWFHRGFIMSKVIQSVQRKVYAVYKGRYMPDEREDIHYVSCMIQVVCWPCLHCTYILGHISSIMW